MAAARLACVESPLHVAHSIADYEGAKRSLLALMEEAGEFPPGMVRRSVHANGRGEARHARDPGVIDAQAMLEGHDFGSARHEMLYFRDDAYYSTGPAMSSAVDPSMLPQASSHHAATMMLPQCWGAAEEYGFVAATDVSAHSRRAIAAKDLTPELKEAQRRSKLLANMRATAKTLKAAGEMSPPVPAREVTQPSPPRMPSVTPSKTAGSQTLGSARSVHDLASPLKAPTPTSRRGHVGEKQIARSSSDAQPAHSPRRKARSLSPLRVPSPTRSTPIQTAHVSGSPPTNPVAGLRTRSPAHSQITGQRGAVEQPPSRAKDMRSFGHHGDGRRAPLQEVLSPRCSQQRPPDRGAVTKDTSLSPRRVPSQDQSSPRDGSRRLAGTFLQRSRVGASSEMVSPRGAPHSARASTSSMRATQCRETASLRSPSKLQRQGSWSARGGESRGCGLTSSSSRAVLLREQPVHHMSSSSQAAHHQSRPTPRQEHRHDQGQPAQQGKNVQGLHTSSSRWQDAAGSCLSPRTAHSKAQQVEHHQSSRQHSHMHEPRQQPQCSSNTCMDASSGVSNRRAQADASSQRPSAVPMEPPMPPAWARTRPAAPQSGSSAAETSSPRQQAQRQAGLRDSMMASMLAGPI